MTLPVSACAGNGGAVSPNKSKNMANSVKIAKLAQKYLGNCQIMIEHDVLDLLTDMSSGKEKSGKRKSQTNVARDLGFSTGFIGDVLHGRRNVTEKLAERLGLEQIVVYVSR